MSQFMRGPNRGGAIAVSGAAVLGAALYYKASDRNPNSVSSGKAARGGGGQNAGSEGSPMARTRSSGSGEVPPASHAVATGKKTQEESKSKTQTVAPSNLPREDVDSKKGHWLQGRGGSQSEPRA